MDIEDYQEWIAFRNNSKSNVLLKHELELISKLHAKYLNHKYKYVGGCNCTGTIKKVQSWINDINKVFSDGHK